MFVKLWSDILESSLWDESSDIRIVWITLLAMSNQDGYVRGTDKAIGRRAGVPEKSANEAIAKFLAPDPCSHIEEHEGRRIERVPGGFTLLNYAHYRELQRESDRREYMKNLMAEKRAAEKAASTKPISVSTPLAGVSNVSGQVDTDTEADTEERNRIVGGKPPLLPLSDILEVWNDHAKAYGFRQARKIDGERARALKARWKDADWRENWQEAVRKIGESPFLLGENDRGWKADMDWFLGQKTLNRLLEGTYGGRKPTSTGLGKELIEEMEREKQEAARNEEKSLRQGDG